ncbi:hypothetical protein K8S19_00480 [bacterium]|nr:hypothetical protein [bacterium]
MWVCDHCGQPMDDKAKKCSMCGVIKPEEIIKKAEAAQVSQSFDFSEKAGAKKPEIHKAVDTVQAEPEAPSQVEPVNERPIVTIFRRLVVSSKFWIVLASVVLAFILVPWTIQKINQFSTANEFDYDAKSVETTLCSKFELIIDDTLPDKLEWAREVMRLRLPTRFPEELLLDISKQEAEVKYENDEKTSVSFRMLITYHFGDAHKKTYYWQPVTFFFEIRNGEWVLIGDRWLRESELVFE